MMRLDRYLANQGIGTRKEVKKLIRQGQIMVNGVIQWKDDCKIDEETAVVSCNGEILHYQKYIYILMNKEPGFVCANQDSLHPTVFDCLPPAYQQCSTVGRLDKDTSGLLLITNDGVLAHRLLSPVHHVEKGYEAVLRLPIDQKQTELLQKEMDLGDFITMPAKVKVLDENRIHLYICEGKFHQVKRMLQAVGNEVIRLNRFSFGPLQLDDDLPQGEWRLLTNDEIALLKEVANR